MELTNFLWLFDVRKICMVPGDCDSCCQLRSCWRWWMFLPIFVYFEQKKKRQNFVMMKKKTGLMLFNMYSPTFVPHLMTLAWKISPEMTKFLSSLNGPLCTYFVRQNLRNRTPPRSWAIMNVLATFENDLRKNMDSANVDFECAKLEYA